MKVVNQYIIPFKGLKEGNHNYDFVIGKLFFEEYLLSVIPSGQITAKVELLKRSTFLELNVTLIGVVQLQCDRCLELFDFDLEYYGDFVVKFKEEPEEPDEDIMYIHPNDDFLDLTQYFIDSIGLSIPIQKIHPEKEDGLPGCDEEMLKIIDKHSNYEQKDPNEVDPRWSKLKDLLNGEN